MKVSTILIVLVGGGVLCTAQHVERHQQQQQQGLSLAGYIPTTDVTYQSTIDIDQQEMEEILSQIVSSDSLIYQQQQINDAYSIYTQRLRTLAGMEGTTFRLPSNTNEFLPFFNIFLNFMGSADYAHDFIVSGFNGTATTSGYYGNFKFNVLHLPGGLQQVIQLGTVLLTIPQYIVRNIDVAIYECTVCAMNNTDPCLSSMLLLDEAVAYYVGSIQDILTLKKESYNGYLLYSTAERLCQLFNTCDGTITINNNGETTTTVPVSRVNMIVLQQFRNIQQSFVSNLNCNEAITYRNIIVTQLFIPMIQGIIRSIYYTSQDIVSEYCIADATMYAASILPLLFNCSNDDANILFEETRPDRNSNVPTNATLVQDILQRNYVCLGISEENDIGTLDPSIMVEWGNCGQPTPAPIVPVPIMSLQPTIIPTQMPITDSPMIVVVPVPPTPPTSNSNNNSIMSSSKDCILLLLSSFVFMAVSLLL